VSAACVLDAAALFFLETPMRALLFTLLLGACTEQASTFPPEESASMTSPAPSSTEPSVLAQMPAWEAARVHGVDFRGVGQEPGWMVDVYTQDRIVLLLDYGESILTFPLTEPVYPQEGVTRYQSQADGRALTLTIRRRPCQDAMSGEPFPASVEVLIDGRTLNGCGRTV
jgi:uncharacterized membrane protein